MRMKEDEMGSMCSKYGGSEKRIRRDHFGSLNI